MITSYNVLVYSYIILNWIKEIEKIMSIKKVTFFKLMISSKTTEFFFNLKTSDKIEIAYTVLNLQWVDSSHPKALVGKN